MWPVGCGNREHSVRWLAILVWAGLRCGRRYETVRPSPSGTGETVLVVEDEESLRTLIERVLTRHGYKVLVAGDGRQALHLLITIRDTLDAATRPVDPAKAGSTGSWA
jgi:hypothetical protein